MLIVMSYTLTGTPLNVTHAASMPPTPPPVTLAVCVIVPPPATGTSENVTGTVKEIFPKLPSASSVMSAHKVIGPAVPPAVLTFTDNGLEERGVTTAFSRATVRVLSPELERMEGVG